MSKHWGLISTKQDLEAGIKQAEGGIFVGVTSGKKLYRLIDKRPQEIQQNQAAEYLGVDPKVVAMIVDSNGAYVIPEPVKEPAKVEVAQPEPEPQKAPESVPQQENASVQKTDVLHPDSVKLKELKHLLKMRKTIDDQITEIINEE